MTAPTQKRNELGILVIGFVRPEHLEATLTSLANQTSLQSTHIWIDGTQGRKEFGDANQRCISIAKKFDANDLVVIDGHLGIEKLMLDAVDDMAARYDRVLIIEDDCLPLENSVQLFEEALNEVKNRPDVFSVYGHHFGTEPEGSRDFTRFQGWGWAAHSDKIQSLLPTLREWFLWPERKYVEFTQRTLSAEILSKLDKTPGRDVFNVFTRFYSWDSATALLTAMRGMLHYRTAKPCIQNTGLNTGVGHFNENTARLRSPPFNMVSLDDVVITPTEPKYSREFLVIGHPRGGTMFTCELFKQLGLNVGHERDGNDGIASWMLVTDAENAPFAAHEIAEHRKNLSWNHLVLPVRHIATAAASIMREDERAPASRDFRRRTIKHHFGIDIAEYRSYFVSAVASYVYWMKMALLLSPDMIFRIEDEAENLCRFVLKVRPDCRPKEKLLVEPINSNKLYKGVRYPKPAICEKDWLSLPNELVHELNELNEIFGYERLDLMDANPRSRQIQHPD